MSQWQHDEDKEVMEEVDQLNKINHQDESGPFHWAVGGPPGLMRKKKVKLS